MTDAAPPSRSGWRVNREISLGNFLTAVTLLIAVLAWGFALEARVQVIENIVLENRIAVKEFSGLEMLPGTKAEFSALRSEVSLMQQVTRENRDTINRLANEINKLHIELARSNNRDRRP